MCKVAVQVHIPENELNYGGELVKKCLSFWKELEGGRGREELQ